MRVVSATAVRGMRDGFELVAEQLFDRALAAGTLDAIPDLVQPFPLTVFPDAVGLAKEGRENLLTYGAMVFGAFGPVTPWYEELMLQAPAVGAWILAHCQRDALAPVGLGASIYAAADAGEITDAEATLLVRSLLSAGVDTTIDSIGLALRCLIDHPDQWRLLREDRRLWRAPRSRRPRDTIPPARACSAPPCARSSSPARSWPSMRRCWCWSAPPGATQPAGTIPTGSIFAAS